MTHAIATSAAEGLRKLRQQRPLVHNITNYVVMDISANALLAVGASPVMAHAAEEVEEMVGLAGALVINIGTLSPAWVDAMLAAGRAAKARGIPVVLDPVGAGATRYRTETALRILSVVRPPIVRGNASEILALVRAGAGRTKGVDASRGIEEAREAALELARRSQTVVAVTGPEDLVCGGSREIRVANGHPLMGRVTGTGCVASALTGAFAAVEPDPLVAAAAALVVFGVVGELAAAGDPRPGSFRTRMIDALDEVTPETVLARARVTES